MNLEVLKKALLGGDADFETAFTPEVVTELVEQCDRIKELEDDYDVLFRFLIGYCALPKGSTMPDVGITATEAYIHSMTNGTKLLKPRLEKFINFAQHFLSKAPG